MKNIMTGALDWIRPKSAATSVPTMQEQAAAAVANLHQAQAAEREAQHAFDETGSAEAVAALKASRSRTADAQEHVARSTRLIDHARSEEARVARLRLEQRRDELREALKKDGRIEASLKPTVDREVQAILAAAEAFAERWNLEDELDKLDHELNSVLRRLGEIHESAIYSGRDRFYAVFAVGGALREVMKTFGDNNPRTKVLKAIAATYEQGLR